MEPSILKSANRGKERFYLGKRRTEFQGAPMTLTELDPDSFIDHIQAGDVRPGQVVTSGKMRETCSKCKDVHLELVLRQKDIKTAYLVCANCGSCFDVKYADGASALAL